MVWAKHSLVRRAAHAPNRTRPALARDSPRRQRRRGPASPQPEGVDARLRLCFVSRGTCEVVPGHAVALRSLITQSLARSTSKAHVVTDATAWSVTIRLHLLTISRPSAEVRPDEPPQPEPRLRGSLAVDPWQRFPGRTSCARVPSVFAATLLCAGRGPETHRGTHAAPLRNTDPPATETDGSALLHVGSLGALQHVRSNATV